MKNRLSTQFALPLFIALSATCGTQALAQQTVTFGGQGNTSAISSGITLQNIHVTETAVLGSSAFGNITSVSLGANAAGNTPVVNNTTVTFPYTQVNSGSGNASVAINGNSEFKALTVNATAGGNIFSSTLSASGTNNTLLMPAQINTGNQGASITWSVDPTGQAFLNSTAIGNGQFLTFK